MPSFAQPVRAIGGAVVVFAALTACSTTNQSPTEVTVPTAGETSSPEATPTESATLQRPSAEPTKAAESTNAEPDVDVRIEGDEVLPNAQEIKLSTGEALSVRIDSDRAGELHVHSTPEQFVEFGAGTTEAEITVTTPGSVEVEDHETGAVIALIEVR